MAAAPLIRPAAAPGLWRLRRRPVCASTEIELDRWLAELDGQPQLERSGLVVVARRQRHGRGQWQRQWQSPPGGLWLSAAFAWPGEPATELAPLTLATAVGLALQLEALGVAPQIKWPNDLMLQGRKLAGILARQRLQGGRVRWARVGVGLNGINRVPAGAIALGEVLPHAPHSHYNPRASAAALLPRVLAALHWAQRHAKQPELVQQLAQARLLNPSDGWPRRDGD
ncbi:MAG: biotin--[acetyl-CoA-carboxylase] ligase [Cyanobacteriota bacterium]|nr:biotin--[acetyl-CoA-carboxylase] ligase [Cyanobacteriota bacterium]